MKAMPALAQSQLPAIDNIEVSAWYGPASESKLRRYIAEDIPPRNTCQCAAGWPPHAASHAKAVAAAGPVRADAGRARFGDSENWVRIRAGRPSGELRTNGEQRVVRQDTVKRAFEL